MAITLDSKSPICLDSFRKWGPLDPWLFNSVDPTHCYECPIQLPDNCEWWMQYTWQDRIMNRELLAQRLCDCAEEIRDYLGTFVAPTWVSERHEYPAYWMTERRKSIGIQSDCGVFKTNCWGVNQFGQPLYTNHETVTTTPIDKDLDGLDEAHEIVFQLPTGIELDELRFYFVGNTLKTGLPDEHYEICSVRQIDYDEDTNEVCVRFDSWNIIDPVLYTVPSWQEVKTPLRACDDIYVDEIEVWSETKDPCKPEVEVFWFSDGCHCNGAGTCGKCDVISRFACVRPLDLCEGLYSFTLVGEDEEGCPDPTVTCVDAPCYPPAYYKVYYNAGEVNKSVNRALFMLTASKFQEISDNCSCDCVRTIFGQYNSALVITDQEERYRFTNIRAGDLYKLPFTPTVGGWEAWRILRNIKENRCC